MTEEKPISVEDNNFSDQVEKAQGLSVIDFWAEWCGPCKMIAPVLDEMARDYQGKVNFFKLDVDANRKTAQRYNVRSIPTLLFFKDGKVVEMVIGVRSKKELAKLVDKHLQ
ncbi:MAG: thioredoxin [Candidatus Glassbacteria bacterium RBG_16_58_8]|uniref:Thioredoxin n=1 Tax=Candidatus Glassbacteria bacterium RBG_16_58_8 TaxID=1817866 RepID=A0A1F5YCC2_9BACT|nr:MAG: thioredoxin [Candidatus Glassbacteria bacterium RBG_16_58_8]